MAARPRSLASRSLTSGIALLLLGTVAAVIFYRPHTQLPRVRIGTRDEVYYYHAATPEDARDLGEALVKTGYLNDRGTTVLLSKGTAGTVISFVLNEGGWDHPDAVYSFEEIGRRVAGSIGGFPIKVRLIDSHRVLHKEVNVGKAIVSGKDAVYYFGSATEADARAVGEALQAAGFLRDAGISVVLSKGDGTSLSFVVNEGVWKQPEILQAFERLVRVVAPSAGGLPVQLRLLDDGMLPRKSVMVR
jgi:hypothetical protein